MSTAEQIIKLIKDKKSQGSQHFSTNDSAGGFRVDVSKTFKGSPKFRREVREFNQRFSTAKKQK